MTSQEKMTKEIHELRLTIHSLRSELKNRYDKIEELHEELDSFQDWVEHLAEIVDDGDESTYSNPEADQLKILLDVFRAYKKERDNARADVESLTTKLRASLQLQRSVLRMDD